MITVRLLIAGQLGRGGLADPLHLAGTRDSRVPDGQRRGALRRRKRSTLLFNDADRTLLDLRGPSRNGPGWNWAVGRWARGGIALIAPDGHVVDATPDANTAGWPSLMTQPRGAGDMLAIGEPIPGRMVASDSSRWRAGSSKPDGTRSAAS